MDDHRIDINRRMENRKSFDIIELERTEKVILEEPKMAFDYLKLELRKQSRDMRIPEDDLKNSERLIITHPGTDRNTSRHAFIS